MADFTLVITVPDAKVVDFVKALNWHYGQIEDPADSGTFRDRTGAELKALVNAGTIQALKDIYARFKKWELAQTTIDTNIDIA